MGTWQKIKVWFNRQMIKYKESEEYEEGLARFPKEEIESTIVCKNCDTRTMKLIATVDITSITSFIVLYWRCMECNIRCETSYKIDKPDIITWSDEEG